MHLSIKKLHQTFTNWSDLRRYQSKDYPYFAQCMLMLSSANQSRTDDDAHRFREYLLRIIHSVETYEDVHKGNEEFPGHAYGVLIVTTALKKFPTSSHLSFTQPLIQVEKRIQNLRHNRSTVLTFARHCHAAMKDIMKLEGVSTKSSVSLMY